MWCKAVTILLCTLCGNFAFAAVGDVWNAKEQWSDISNPNGVWSYHSANGVPMVHSNGDPGTCGGAPSDWEDVLWNCPNLFDEEGWAGGHEPDEFCGHGPWMVRWTSPIDGFVEVNGTLWQKFEPARQMSYILTYNGTDDFASDVIPKDGGGATITGPAGEVSFGPICRRVNIGDTIDFIVLSVNPVSTFAVASFWVEQVDGSTCPLPPPNIEGDINRDDQVNIEDLAELVLQWARQDCIDPRWCEGADIDESTEVDYADFSYLAANWQEQLFWLHKMGYIVVSPDGPVDGGDFGNLTPGTVTAGLQEAFNYAVQYGKDVFIAGKYYLYFTHATLNIPAAKNFKLAGQGCLINYTPSTGPALTIDSQVNSRISWGGVIAPGIGTTEPVVIVKPQTPAPDGTVRIANSEILFNVIVGGGDPFGGQPGKGNGLIIDPSTGPVVNNRFYAEEFNALNIGLHVKSGNFSYNQFRTPFLHICNELMIVEPGAACNVFDVHLDGSGIENPVGARIASTKSIYTVYAANTGTSSGLIFEPEARDNLIYATALNSFTNNATNPTNRIVDVREIGFSVTTPAPGPSGTDVVNDTCYSIKALILTAGNVSSWTLTDGNGNARTFNAGLRAGQIVTLEPGDSIKFTYSSPPTWTWRSLR